MIFCSNFNICRKIKRKKKQEKTRKKWWAFCFCFEVTNYICMAVNSTFTRTATVCISLFCCGGEGFCWRSGVPNCMAARRNWRRQPHLSCRLYSQCSGNREQEDGASNGVGLMCVSFGHSLRLKMGVFFRTMCAASNVYHSVVWTAVMQQGDRLTIASFTPCWSTIHLGDVTGMRKHDHLSLTTRSGGLFVFYML